MRARAIVHQQIYQLRWHLLACLGLLMVLPIEEAIVSLRAGDGFYSDRMVLVALLFSPLLAGLIACANVQGDLSEKLYIFWRSKPANVKKLMALKFVVGLIASFAIIACPLVFAVVTGMICGEDLDDPSLKFFVPMMVLIAVMTYSLCFVCNVLVRNTARGWLIGMLLAGFVLVFPFMLPFGFTDIVTDVGMWALSAYSAIIVIMSIAAFVCALYAAQHDWHLKTNLKGLLGVAAGLVFLLLILFSSQVANIRVLDEEIIGGFGALDRSGNRIIFKGQNIVEVGKKGFTLKKIGPDNAGMATYPTHGNLGIDSKGHRTVYGPRIKGYQEKTYPDFTKALYMNTTDGTYYFSIISYYRLEGEASRIENFYEKVYLRSYKLVGDSWQVIGELDISEFLTDPKNWIRMAMRLVDKTLIACVNHSLVAVDVTEPDNLKLIDKKLDVLQGGTRWMGNEERQKEFFIPLVPVDGIAVEERIKLSIDLAYRFGRTYNQIYDSSIVDIHDNKIAFFSATERDVSRFDVIRWDDEKICCKFSAARPFTVLESMVRPYGGPDERVFVQDQMLYLAENQQLMVFDVRSDRRIRKVGHFYRMDCNIEDIEIYEDGRILLCARFDHTGGKKSARMNRYLYLLEKP